MSAADDTAQKRYVQPDDIDRIHLLNDPQVSPDGRRVAYTVTTPSIADNRYRAAIWLIDVDGTHQRRLTSGQHRDGSPRWSPDGTAIAFTSDRTDSNDERKGQVWLIEADGGEPRRISALDKGIESFAWSPDGRSLLAVSKVREYPAHPNPNVRHVRTVRYRFDGEGYLDDHYRQIFVIDVATGAARQLTSGPFEHNGAAWSPNGHEIAFTSNREPGWEFSNVRDIYRVRVGGSTGAIRRVTDGSGHWDSPAWSPDGATIACFGSQRLDSDAARTELFTVPAAGGTPQSLTNDWDVNLRDGCIGDMAQFSGRAPLWDADGRSITTVHSVAGTVHLARVDLGGDISVLTSGRRRLGAPALLPDGAIAYIAASATEAGELAVRDSSGTERVLTSHNADWQAQVTVIEPEPFTVASADGREIHGWIMKPADFREGVKYPLLLEIHGGPFGMYGESLMHEFQVLAAEGHVVLFTNPRGSTGYGDDFAGSLFRAWGKNDFPDLMAAVDWAINQGYVDERRLGVLGGSYGGYMTNWVITHTTRFRAAITMRTLANMHSTYGTDDIYFAMAKQTIGAEPWIDPDIYWELSPIEFVERVETPLLIEMQEEDWRCPPEQSEQLFRALKRLGKTVEMVRYPNESHGMSRTGQPKHRRERLSIISEWFDRYL